MKVSSFDNYQELKKAEKYYLKALKNFIGLNHYNQVNTYHELGSLAQIQYEWTKAEAYYRKAIDAFRQSNNTNSTAKPIGQLGLLKKKQGKFDEAKDYLLQALQIFHNFNDELNFKFTLSNLRDA